MQYMIAGQVKNYMDKLQEDFDYGGLSFCDKSYVDNDEQQRRMTWSRKLMEQNGGGGEC